MSATTSLLSLSSRNYLGGSMEDGQRYHIHAHRWGASARVCSDTQMRVITHKMVSKGQTHRTDPLSIGIR